MPSYAITHQRLAELLSYQPESGVFIWRQCRNAYKNGQPAGGKSLGYISIMIDGEAYYAHRLAWFYVHREWPELIDHINGDRADNRIENLRVVTPTENGQNQLYTFTNKTGYPGVVRAKNKYTAKIGHGGKYRSLGYFDTARDAFLVYAVQKRLLQPDSYRKMMASLPSHVVADLC